MVGRYAPPNAGSGRDSWIVRQRAVASPTYRAASVASAALSGARFDVISPLHSGWFVAPSTAAYHLCPLGSILTSRSIPRACHST
jgi:hypothetical protein